MRVDALVASDWEALRRIHEEGIATGEATFETSAAESWEAWERTHRPDCRLAAREGEELVGWAALSPVSGRCVYGGVAEVSVYICPEHQRLGIGMKLMQFLIDESEKNGYWTLQSGIFPENLPSIELHRKMGFRVLGYRERIGKRDGVWKDNVQMERRSKLVGID